MICPTAKQLCVAAFQPNKPPRLRVQTSELRRDVLRPGSRVRRMLMLHASIDNSGRIWCLAARNPTTVSLGLHSDW